ncbi:hypothetical protein A2311_06350 [candidate division WOR-1 bacterium RIFOXYB2_FULL_48_7]|uniref:Uncharacterized protein n=1 Tax=candidate division WOR-1 bacterium RIFOXYB2_FULL_48_7 TaxID=1802583 RepID=A0A1F4TP63_UNCSA|nr:MAG: hypothetical protein A2311_06350 [candidate division WOR-1 bacterium RIFOXYB2_FULL_48_7]
MWNILSTSKNHDELAGLLRAGGYQILGVKPKEQVLISLAGQNHVGLLEATFTVRKADKKYVVVAHDSIDPLDPTEPALRRALLEYDRFFGLQGVLLVNLQRKELAEVTFKFPRERGLDFFFQFFAAMFFVGLVIGIIALLVYLKLF